MREKLKEKGRNFIRRVKAIQGDPHYIALGMAIGIFVAFTPTIPFHMIIAVIFSFILRGSKPAAMIGVWVSNPATIPFFYVASYKVGMLLIGNSSPCDVKYESVMELLKLGLDVTVAMIAGGALLGIVPAILCYFITRRIVFTFRARSGQRHSS